MDIFMISVACFLSIFLKICVCTKRLWKVKVLWLSLILGEPKIKLVRKLRPKKERKKVNTSFL